MFYAKCGARKPQHNDFARVFDNLFFDFGFGDHNYAMPDANVSETTEGFRIEIAAPGLEKEHFKISLNRNELVISANETLKPKEGERTIRREFGYRNFRRAFRLPHYVEVEKIEANYTNGILSVFVPKKPEAQNNEEREIPII
jgi:HSP20 family protein